MDGDALRASVVVPTHRGAHRLPVLLDALCRQDVTDPWEVVVAVDGVVDETLEVLDRYADRLPLRRVVTEDPRGVVSALNDGFAAAAGEILIRCDDDLTPAPDFVSRHLARHGSRRDLAVIGPTLDVFPDTPYARAYGRDANRRALAAAYTRPADYRWVGWAANNSVHRDSWAAVGGFDPRFVYGQDSELGYRLSRAGVEIVVEPGLQVEHRGPSTTAAARVPRAFVSGASRRLFEQVHPEASRPTERPARLRQWVWVALVWIVSRSLRTREAYARLGRVVDRLLALVPPGVGRRVVALAVEAAGRSGERHGNPDLAAYKQQKAVEIAAETSRVIDG